MEELFESSILDDLFNIRTNGFESLYERKHKNSVEYKSKIEEVLRDLGFDEDKMNNIIEKFEECLFEELNYWNVAYYKIGVIDGIKVSQETKDELKCWKK